MLEIAWLDAGVKSTPRDFASSAASSGPVAQWIEHLIPNQGVAGSNPAGVANEINSLQGVHAVSYVGKMDTASVALPGALAFFAAVGIARPLRESGRDRRAIRGATGRISPLSPEPNLIAKCHAFARSARGVTREKKGGEGRPRPKFSRSP
jgi:hypothetical protein